MKNEFDSLKETVVSETLTSLLDMFQTMCADFHAQIKAQNEERKANVPNCFTDKVQCEEFDW